LNAEELTGRSQSHVVALDEPSCTLHRHAIASLLAMRRAASQEGIDLSPESSFRNFERQLAIWNAKFTGGRTLLDARGVPIDALSLSPAERVDAILLWSALPGASRHHWGTDVDLIDRAAVPPGYRVQLVGEEFAAGGPFAALNHWLEQHAMRFGFFRPFRGLRSGVQPEPWHYSFAPVAETARRVLTVEVLAAALGSAPLEGKSLVLERIDELHERFVARIDLS
jgi:LAS superfamily LD-carboxypeptidase LdcB